MFEISSCGLFTKDPMLEDLDRYHLQEAKRKANMTVMNKSSSADCHSGSDGMQGPDLYTEADEMLESLVLLSSMAELRKRLQRPRSDCPVIDRIHQVPISHAEVMNSLMKNQSRLQRRRFGSDNPLELTKHRPRVTATTILHAKTDSGSQSRFTFSIAINHQRKRVIVCFQNCPLDLENWETRLLAVSNPYRSRDPSVRDHIHIHEGFLSLLGSERNPWSEVSRMISEQVSPVLKRHQGYRLFATGFKNGAALATLFSVYAASRPIDEVPTPVYLFSFGSPYIGDQAFRETHQCLENLGRLRHLRVANFMDYTPLTPQMSLRFDVFKPMFFKHVGVQLKLHDGLFPPEVSYPQTDGGLIGNAADELKRGWGQSILASMPLNPLEWPEHELKDYIDRMLLNKALLQGLRLDRIYSQHHLVAGKSLEP